MPRDKRKRTKPKREEKLISDLIRERLTECGDTALFCNNNGVGWVGKFVSAHEGLTTLLGATRLDFGLFPGSPDLVGWKRIRITPAHVGKTIAVFVGIEVKDPQGTHSSEQLKFLARLKKDGAITGTARSVEDALSIMEGLEPVEPLRPTRGKLVNPTTVEVTYLDEAE